MNDRFKFRVWDKINSKWVERCLLDIENGYLLGYYDNQQAYKRRYAIMQSTGLKDKNGKLIYEGDIINIWCKNFTKNQISEVKFCKERAAFTFDYYTDFGNIVPCTMDKTEIEVIGNIYQDSHLLEN